MASSPNDLSQVLLPLADTLPPQSITGNTNGVGVSLAGGGTNRFNARLSIGAGVGFTGGNNVVVKMQSSPDNSTWSDILNEQGVAEVFPTITAANVATYLPTIIPLQLPRAASVTASAPIYVRAVATISGITSLLISVGILYASRFGGGAPGFQNQPPYNN